MAIYDFMLWGWHPDYKGPDGSVIPIKLAGGSWLDVRAAMNQRKRESKLWRLDIYRSGVEPEGLIAQCIADGYGPLSS